MAVKVINEIRTINENEKIKWLQKFPSMFGGVKYNGANARETALAIKRLQLSNIDLQTIRDIAEDNNMMYNCSMNHHNCRWGLDKQDTPQGGGIVAQADTREECLQIATDIYGIHPIFIWGVSVDGF